MEAILARAIKASTGFRQKSVPWTLDEPYPQTYYEFDPATTSWVSTSSSAIDGSTDAVVITSIALYTWNIDFMLPFASARMRPALAHLHQLTGLLPPNAAPVIFLQECTSSDLETISTTPWVQGHFYLTDIDTTNWATQQYGTTTLVSKRLPIASIFRVHYAHTRMDRDALFIDISIDLGKEKKQVRLCNTHLESLALEPPFRPLQMQLIARYLHQDGVHAGIVAGDFNAIQPDDRLLHVQNNLKDAFLQSGGEEDTEKAYTWGQQASTTQRAQFGCSRMDKIYFHGPVRLLEYGRFGVGLLAEGVEEQRQIVELGFEEPWVTDHLGVMALLEL